MKKPKVKKVTLKPTEVLHVSLPPKSVPVVVQDAAKRVVGIIPATSKKKKTWWEWLSSDD